MASRPTALQAICRALAAAHVASGRIDRTLCGNMAAHSSTCIPPIEPPITASQRRTPRWSDSRACTRTMSRTVTTPKSGP